MKAACCPRRRFSITCGNDDWGGGRGIVESYISYLRKKVDGIVIEDENGDKHKVTPLIETKRGIGYMIRAPKN